MSRRSGGVPAALFIDNVPNEAAKHGGIEELLKNLQEMLAKYRFMESTSQRRRQGLQEKIPEFEKTLSMISQLQDQSEGDDLSGHEVTFELADTLYAQATIPKCDQVFLWLGANTMLAYPLDEAEQLLSGKLSSTHDALERVGQDLAWLRDQVTTTQVNIARVYNWEVRQRRAAGTTVGAK